MFCFVFVFVFLLFLVQEQFYIDGLGSPDQVHCASIKIIEITPLEVFLCEFDRFCRSDTAVNLQGCSFATLKKKILKKTLTE